MLGEILTIAAVFLGLAGILTLVGGLFVGLLGLWIDYCEKRFGDEG